VRQYANLATAWLLVQVVIYFFAGETSVGDTVILIRNATVLPHSCPVQPINNVNSFSSTTDAHG